MKRINVHLTKEQIKKLKEIHEEKGRTVAETIRKALDEYLEIK